MDIVEKLNQIIELAETLDKNIKYTEFDSYTNHQRLSDIIYKAKEFKDEIF